MELGKVITVKELYDHLKKQELHSKNGKLVQKYGAWQIIEYYTIKDIHEDISHILEEIDYDLSNVTLLELYEDDIFTWYGLTDSLESFNDISNIMREIDNELVKNNILEWYKENTFKWDGLNQIFKAY